MDLSHLLRNTPDVHKETRRKALAGMETGAHSAVRTLLREYRELHPEHARSLEADLVAAYGITF